MHTAQNWNLVLLSSFSGASAPLRGPLSLTVFVVQVISSLSYTLWGGRLLLERPHAHGWRSPNMKPSLSRPARRRCCVTKISIKCPRSSERVWCRRPRRARLAHVTSQRGHLWSVWGENRWMCGERLEAPGSSFTRWWEVDSVPVRPCELW